MGTTAVENDFLKQLEEAYGAGDEMLATALSPQSPPPGQSTVINPLAAMMVQNTRQEMREGSVQPPQATVREELAMSAMDQGLGSRPRSYQPPLRMAGGGVIPRYNTPGIVGASASGTVGSPILPEEEEELGFFDTYGPAMKAVGSEIFDDVTDVDAVDLALLGLGATGVGATVAGPAATMRRIARFGRNIPKYLRTGKSAYQATMRGAGRGVDRLLPVRAGGRGPLSIGRADPRGVNRTLRALGRDPKTGQMVTEAARLQRLGEAGSRLGVLTGLGYGAKRIMDSPDAPVDTEIVEKETVDVPQDNSAARPDPLARTAAPAAPSGNDFVHEYQRYLRDVLNPERTFGKSAQNRDRGSVLTAMAAKLLTPEASGGGIGGALEAGTNMAAARKQLRQQDEFQKGRLAANLSQQRLQLQLREAANMGTLPQMIQAMTSQDLNPSQIAFNRARVMEALQPMALDRALLRFGLDKASFSSLQMTDPDKAKEIYTAITTRNSKGSSLIDIALDSLMGNVGLAQTGTTRGAITQP